MIVELLAVAAVGGAVERILHKKKMRSLIAAADALGENGATPRQIKMLDDYGRSRGVEHGSAWHDTE